MWTLLVFFLRFFCYWFSSCVVAMIYSEFEEHVQNTFAVSGQSFLVILSEEITVVTRVSETLADCDTRPKSRRWHSRHLRQYYCVHRVWICTQKLNSIFVIFCIHQTLSGFLGIQLDSHSECLENSTERSYHENKLQDNSRCGKLVLLIHMSDSRLQIAPRRPKKIHGAWDSTYICRHTLRLYFQEDLQV
jgi:hypothetical protein